MKFLARLLMMIAGVANAGTSINLPLPSIAAILPPGTIAPSGTCYQFLNEVHPHTVATGFSADGNYVTGTADDVAHCGGSGRGGGIHYYPYCASFTWDLSGNLVSTVVGTCSKAPSGAVYTNAGYTESTFVQLYFGYIQYEYPTLETP